MIVLSVSCTILSACGQAAPAATTAASAAAAQTEAASAAETAAPVKAAETAAPAEIKAPAETAIAAEKPTEPAKQEAKTKTIPQEASAGLAAGPAGPAVPRLRPEPAEPAEPEETEETGEEAITPVLEPVARSLENNVSDSVFRAVQKKLCSDGYYGFMHSLYNDPRDVDWDEVFYDGAGYDQGYPSDEIIEEFLKATGDEELFTDLTVVSGKDVRNHVKKTTGYDYSEMRNTLDYIYLKDRDLYLHEHGDTNHFSPELLAVHFENGEYTASYYYWDDTERCITFRDEGGSYRIISNLPADLILDPDNGGDVDQSMITAGMIFPESDSRRLTEAELKGMTAQELRIARNEIYARRGRKFSDSKLQKYFETMDWYVPMFDASQFNEGIFNEFEKYNLELIAEYEKKAGN